MIRDFVGAFLPSCKTDFDAPFDPKHFTRNRKIPLPIAIGLVLNMVRPGKRVGYQEVIDRFFSAIAGPDVEDPLENAPDASAFCRARPRIPQEVFHLLFDRASQAAIDRTAALESCRWHGLRVHALDGTKVTLPWSEALAEFFGVPSGAHYPQALVCTLYDVLAKTPLDVMWGPYRASERTLARELYAPLGSTDLLLLDRGFPSFAIFSDLVGQGTHFLCRIPKNGLFSEVTALIAKGRKDALVTLAPPADLVRQCVAAGEPVPEPIVLRFIQVRHPKVKQPAYFLTTLTDREHYSRRALSDLYHLRWEGEEFFKLTKELLEIERLRGTKPLLVHQEIIAIHLYCILTRLLILEAAQRHGIPPAKIAQQHAFYAVSRYLDHLLTADTPEKRLSLLDRCIREIARRRYTKRPNRSYPRRSQSSYGKWGRKGRAAA